MEAFNKVLLFYIHHFKNRYLYSYVNKHYVFPVISFIIIFLFPIFIIIQNTRTRDLHVWFRIPSSSPNRPYILDARTHPIDLY